MLMPVTLVSKLYYARDLVHGLTTWQCNYSHSNG